MNRRTSPRAAHPIFYYTMAFPLFLYISKKKKKKTVMNEGALISGSHWLQLLFKPFFLAVFFLPI